VSDTPKANKWREQLREVGGMNNRLVGIPAGGVREIIDDLAETESALAAANKRANDAQVRYYKEREMITVAECEKYRNVAYTICNRLNQDPKRAFTIGDGSCVQQWQVYANQIAECLVMVEAMGECGLIPKNGA